MVLVGLLAAAPGGQALCVKHYAIAFDVATLDAACDAAEVAFLPYRSEQAFTRLLELKVEDRFLVRVVRVGQRYADPLARNAAICSRGRDGFRDVWRGQVS